jgi:hypothetical protein
MARILLLGAGFSRNWGGWLASEVFEYLLGCPEIAPLRDLVFRNKRKGFEAALAELQKDRHAEDLLRRFYAALRRMFADMDRAFHGTRFEFSNDIDSSVAGFLTRFDAIFTLNQDLLLERHYLNDNVSLLSNGRWDGWCLPGMRLLTRPENALVPDTLGIWAPEAGAAFNVARRCQPLFKLHGSSNWRAGADQDIIVLGGQKAELIDKHPILHFNFNQFDEHLRKRDTRLMVIGYGFADDHVNAAIMAAVRASSLTMSLSILLGSM